MMRTRLATLKALTADETPVRLAKSTLHEIAVANPCLDLVALRAHTRRIVAKGSFRYCLCHKFVSIITHVVIPHRLQLDEFFL